MARWLCARLTKRGSDPVSEPAPRLGAVQEPDVERAPVDSSRGFSATEPTEAPAERERFPRSKSAPAPCKPRRVRASRDFEKLLEAMPSGDAAGSTSRPGDSSFALIVDPLRGTHENSRGYTVFPEGRDASTVTVEQRLDQLFEEDAMPDSAVPNGDASSSRSSRAEAMPNGVAAASTSMSGSSAVIAGPLSATTDALEVRLDRLF